MILRKISIDNFRQLYGHGEIRFAQPGDRNVTVVLGQNGSGKTTLLNAFLWCLYDRIELENPTEIVSHKALQEVNIGDEVPAEVTLVFQDRTKCYTATRRAVFRKLDGGGVEEVGTSEFRVDVMDLQRGTTEPAPDPKQLISQVLPQGLSHFFFFRGEDMENLALQSSAPELAKGVAEFLNFNLLDRAIKDLKKTGQDFEAELAKIAVGDTKLLAEQIAEAEADVSDAEAKVLAAQESMLECEKRREGIERALAEVEETRPYLEQKETLKVRKDDLIRQEKEDRKRLSAIISRDGFLVGSVAVLSTPIELADDAVKRGELPAKIKPKFVDDLLAIGTCVCGNKIDEAAREKLLAWRGSEGLAAFEESINVLRNAAQRLRTRRERFVTDLTAARAQWAQTSQDIQKVTEQMSAIDSELQGKDFGLDYVRSLQNRLKEVCDDIIAAGANVTRAQDQVVSCQQILEKLREDRKRRTKDEKEANTIQKRFDATQSVAEALQKIRQEWLLIVQQYLDGQLKQNWESVAQLDRLVEFTPGFQLGIKERGPDGNWTTSAPSSANLRALALCFVSALIKLASDIGADARQKGDQAKREQLFQGGDYPLVMDAPFATMDRYFKQAVPTGLRQVVPQMAIISNYDQWSGDVENVLRPALGSAYVLELHTPGNNEDNNSIQFGGQAIDYVIGEPEAVTDWSQIREVTL